MLHGVNVVYKLPPFEVYPDPGKPWNFSRSDAAAIARLGFDVVRLGILWQGLEPGHGGPNQPRICTPGRPRPTHELDVARADSYLRRVAQTVDLLGRFHIYTLLDMHQDVFNQAFGGEGAPSWAVCTNGEPPIPVPGRWSRNYSNPALDIAINHFWRNDVLGDLQGQFDRVWGIVARYFRNNRWILGYDPFNEPFSQGVVSHERHAFAVSLECFYTGRRHPGRIDARGPIVSCPRHDPQQGVIPTIESADPHHLVFVEPDIFSRRERPGLLGAMPWPRLVIGFHAYCPDRNPVTGQPLSIPVCSKQVLATLVRRMNERRLMSSGAQPGGPAWFLSEFGASQSPGLLARITSDTDRLELGWTYWAWKRYDDPTGSLDEALASASGAIGPDGAALSQTYAQAVGGRPVTTWFDFRTGSFRLTYAASPSVRGPTVISVAWNRYRHGYCTTVSGGRVTSPPGARDLVVSNEVQHGLVSVRLIAGPCRAPWRA